MAKIIEFKNQPVRKDEDGEAEGAVYRGTTKDGTAFLCFDLSLMEEEPV